jgi:hypothetical protein
VSRWRGDEAARRAVYNNRARLRPGVAHEAFRLRAELVERGFALVLDRGGMRRAWLRGRENLQKRYLVHVAGYNLGLIMRLLAGAGTPRGSWPAARRTCSPSHRPTVPRSSSSSSRPAPKPRCSRSALNQSHPAEAGLRQRADRVGEAVCRVSG